MNKGLVETAMEAWEVGDLPKAEKLLIKAAEAGSGHAAHNLGTLYATGGPGVNPDPMRSLEYFEQALASGFEEIVASDPAWFTKET